MNATIGFHAAKQSVEYLFTANLGANQGVRFAALGDLAKERFIGRPLRRLSDN